MGAAGIRSVCGRGRDRGRGRRRDMRVRQQQRITLEREDRGRDKGEQPDREIKRCRRGRDSSEILGVGLKRWVLSI